MISRELLGGSIRTIILKILECEGPLHGYAITQKAEEVTNGKIKLTYGALYPVLHSLKKEKILVTVTDISTGRMRIYYSLTPKGHSMVTEKTKELKELIDSLQKIASLKPAKDNKNNPS
jgi:PadR family transcriptional regulator, regulatory protein PadR